MITFLPRFIESEGLIIDGQLVKCSNSCLDKVKDMKCKQFYELIKTEEGFHQCPYGMSSYVYRNSSEIIIFTCFRMKGYINRALYKKLVFTENNYNPILDMNTMNEIINSCKSEIEYYESQKKLTDFFMSLKHETITWSAEIQTLSEKLIRESTGKKKDKHLMDISLKIFHFGRLIGFNFTRFDLLNDSLTTSTFDKVTEKVYNRFNVIIRCLEPSAKEKLIYINKSGESYSSIKLNLETFDILPYVILENAIKYSPTNQEINISFNEQKERLFIEFESLGPKIEKEEYEKIFEYGYRGKNACETSIKGSGIGLYLAKRVCEIHSIAYSVSSNSLVKIGQKEFYNNKFTFVITL